MPLNVKQIQENRGPRFKEFAVPEWSGTDESGAPVPQSVLARRLGASDFFFFADNTKENPTSQESFALMVGVVRRSLVDPEDCEKPLIDDSNEFLLTEEPQLVMRLGQELLAWNRMLREDAEKN